MKLQDTMLVSPSINSSCSPANRSSNDSAFCRISTHIDVLSTKDIPSLFSNGSQVMYACSNPSASLPHEDTLQQLLNKSDAESKRWLQQAQDAQGTFQTQLDKILERGFSHVNATGMLAPDIKQKAQEEWNLAAAKVGNQVQEMRSVLETSVFPYNRFTQCTGQLRGQSLHMPSVIKSVSSGFTNPNIFAQKTRGGRRQHQVVVALDVSTSM